MDSTDGETPNGEPTPRPVAGDEPEGRAVSETATGPDPAGGGLGLDGDYGGEQSAGASGEGGGPEDLDPASSTEDG